MGNVIHFGFGSEREYGYSTKVCNLYLNSDTKGLVGLKKDIIKQFDSPPEFRVLTLDRPLKRISGFEVDGVGVSLQGKIKGEDYSVMIFKETHLDYYLFSSTTREGITDEMSKYLESEIEKSTEDLESIFD
jgi:hypothetical protein